MVVLARLLKLNYHYLYSIAAGIRKAPIEIALRIENATQGEVTRRDLRPNDWHQIWPELAEKEALKAAFNKKHASRNNKENESGFYG
jgi:DNA-binding transcriptional regulator YdaS (Cro superfamily)